MVPPFVNILTYLHPRLFNPRRLTRSSTSSSEHRVDAQTPLTGGSWCPWSGRADAAQPGSCITFDYAPRASFTRGAHDLSTSHLSKASVTTVRRPPLPHPAISSSHLMIISALLSGRWWRSEWTRWKDSTGRTWPCAPTSWTWPRAPRAAEAVSHAPMAPSWLHDEETGARCGSACPFTSCPRAASSGCMAVTGRGPRGEDTTFSRAPRSPPRPPHVSISPWVRERKPLCCLYTVRVRAIVAHAAHRRSASGKRADRWAAAAAACTESTGGRNVTALNVARRAFLARREREGGIHIASKIHPKGSDLVVSVRTELELRRPAKLAAGLGADVERTTRGRHRWATRVT